MRLPQASPGEGSRSDYEHFSSWSIAGGERHHAYRAGPAYWCIAHPSDKGTKPCLQWMTEGALPCRFCAAHKCPTTVGYFPVWRQIDSRPMLVILYEPEREHVAAVEGCDRLLIGREKERGSALWVRRCLEQEPRFQTTLARRRVEQDVTRSLLVLWRLPELVAWLQKRGPSDNAVSQRPAPAPVAVGESAELFDSANEVFARRVRAAKPSSNGQH